MHKITKPTGWVLRYTPAARPLGYLRWGKPRRDGGDVVRLLVPCSKADAQVFESAAEARGALERDGWFSRKQWRAFRRGRTDR